MIDIMLGVVRGGTGGNAALPNMPVAGKTGTTSDLKDAWFVGYTPYYTAAVWMGHDEPKPMNFTGGSYPARLWKAVMQEIHKDLPRKDFDRPQGLVSVDICTKSGKRPSELCALDPRGATIKSERFIKGTEPPIDSICDTCYQRYLQRIKLASEYCPIESIESKVQRTEPLDTTRNCLQIIYAKLLLKYVIYIRIINGYEPNENDDIITMKLQTMKMATLLIIRKITTID